MLFTSSALRDYLTMPRRLLIVTHQNPDGDAIGSSMGLYHFLVNKGHQVVVVVPNDSPKNLSFLDENKVMLIAEKQANLVQRALLDAEMVFILDLNDYKRMDSFGEAVHAFEGYRVLIDHHLQPQIESNFVLHDINASSTAELVYHFITEIGMEADINKSIATCLYTGICTDTGRFKFNTSAFTLSIVSRLILQGLDMGAINELLFDSNDERQLRLLGFALSERMTIFAEHQAAYIWFSETDLKRFDYQRGDLEGLVNYPLSLANVRFCALFKEDNKKIRASFRSKGDFSVNDYARRFFSGGGHRNAAGGTSPFSDIESTLRFFANSLGNNENKLV